MSTITALPIAKPLTVAGALKAARAKYEEKSARVLAYEAAPVRKLDGSGFEPLPLKWRIALTTATRNLRIAEDAYLAKYPTAKYVRITKPSV